MHGLPATEQINFVKLKMIVMKKYGLFTKNGERINYLYANDINEALIKFSMIKKLPEKIILELFLIEKIN